MTQSIQLIETLKQAIKAHGRTYVDVARHLNLSEASVKRLFSQKSFSLERLDQVCQFLEIEISDLVQLMQEHTAGPISGLTLEQEQEIVGNLELLLIAVCVLNRWTLEEIIDYFQIPEVRCIQHFAHLDRLKMIELLPKNRVKLLVAPNFKWRENGPIQQFFLQRLQSDFFNSRFDQAHEALIVVNGMLADSSTAVFQRKLERLAREFDELTNDDAGLSLDERNGTTVVLAMRHWRYGLFSQFRKNHNQ
ncbi:MAG: helix-turn-helix transcriptional regulator [Gammaproteobacteria bacterium]|nr:helix-turn-helix transcriptional regulator [Gammaproteobacteria bacterium]